MEFKNFSLAINQTKVARFADDLAGGNPIPYAVAVERVFLYLPRAPVAMDIDYVAGSKGRQGA